MQNIGRGSIFEFQQETASAFDYRDKGGLLGVEHFMRDVYTHLQTVSMVTDLFFEHVHEVLGLTSGSAVEQQLERSIVIRGGTVRLTSLEELAERPLLLMRLFLQAGRVGLSLHHRTRQIDLRPQDVPPQFVRVVRLCHDLPAGLVARRAAVCAPVLVDPCGTYHRFSHEFYLAFLPPSGA